MHAPTPADLLAAWEQGASRGAAERGLALLAVACPDTTVEALAGLSLGRRDGLLLRLREGIFGTRITGQCTCAACGADIETSFATDEIRAPWADAPAELHIEVQGCALTLRLPTSRDLSGVEACDPGQARRLLFERCLVAAQLSGRMLSPEAVPDAVIGPAADAMGAADPQGDVILALHCPDCEAAHEVSFDIVAFLWAELESWTGRLLGEVHTLASAYGWGEQDILGMSPIRRRCYLEALAR